MDGEIMEKLREIEDIVPDFEACRKIPADAFQNTVFRQDGGNHSAIHGERFLRSSRGLP